jgi:hypothetical protein
MNNIWSTFLILEAQKWTKEITMVTVCLDMSHITF